MKSKKPMILHMANNPEISKMRKQFFDTYLAISLILGPCYALFFSYHSAWKSLLFAVLFSLIIFFCLLINYTKHQQTGPILLNIAFFIAPAGCIVFTGGLYSPIMIWLAHTCILSIILLGLKWTISFAIFILALLKTCVVFQDKLYLMNELPNENTSQLLLFLSVSSAITVIIFCIYYSQQILLKSNISSFGTKEGL